LWQADLGVKVDYQWLRLGVNGFAGWVNDYITFDRTRGPGNPGTTIIGLDYVNTDLASLWGGEIYGELDLCDFATPFISLSYVEARDETRNDRVGNGLGFVTAKEALPGIPPLDSRVGVRFHDPAHYPRWAVEFSARIVDTQDLVASSLGELTTPHFTIFDLRSYWQCNENLTLTFGIENIDNRFYREHLDLRTGLGVFQPGRSVYAGMEWRR
jgi:outer membrane receptor protein involved in Fe transport